MSRQNIRVLVVVLNTDVSRLGERYLDFRKIFSQAENLERTFETGLRGTN